MVTPEYESESSEFKQKYPNFNWKCTTGIEWCLRAIAKRLDLPSCDFKAAEDFVSKGKPLVLSIAGGSIGCLDEGYSLVEEFEPWVPRYLGYLGADVYNIDLGAQLQDDINGNKKLFHHIPQDVFTMDWEALRELVPEGFSLVECSMFAGDTPAKGFKKAISSNTPPEELLKDFVNVKIDRIKKMLTAISYFDIDIENYGSEISRILESDILDLEGTDKLLDIYCSGL